jgi:hypothetical protein
MKNKIKYQICLFKKFIKKTSPLFPVQVHFTLLEVIKG